MYRVKNVGKQVRNVEELDGGYKYKNIDEARRAAGEAEVQTVGGRC